ncbi:MAG: glycosyltransferase, partial [Bacteroidota bacterium]
ARVLLAPLRFGAGIKGKLTFAMGHGTPSVTTAIGAEGMHADFPWAGEIEDTPELFSQKAIALYQDEQQWRQQQQNGLIILKSIYSREQGTKRFMDKLLLIRNSLKAHRAGNFIGALLRHQTMAATKYMGKWIAEKNKNS